MSQIVTSSEIPSNSNPVIPFVDDGSNLHANAFFAPFQLVFWLFFRPTKWQQQLAAIDAEIPSTVSLFEFEWQQLRNPKLRRILLSGFVMLPLIINTLLVGVLAVFGRFSFLVIIALLLGWLMGILLATGMNVASGIVVSAIGSFVLGIMWSDADIIMVDMIVTARFGVLFGLVSMAYTHVTYNIARNNRTPSSSINLRDIGQGILASAVVLLIVLFVIGGLFVARESDLVPDFSLSAATAGVPGLLIGLAVSWRTLSWRRGLLAFIVLVLILIPILAGMGTEFGHNPGHHVLLILLSLAPILTYAILSVLPYAIVTRAIGPRVGAIFGGLGGLFTFVVNKYSNDIYALWPNLYWAAGFLLLGITMHWWRPVFTYPVQALWDAFINRLADGVGERSLFFYTTVFWDELQWARLDRYLVEVVERNSAIGQIAIGYISNGRQRWASQSAQIELDARQLAHCTTINAIAAVHADIAAGLLASPASALLRSFGKVSEDVSAGQAQLSVYNQRLVLNTVEDDLNSLLRELTRSNERYATRFRPIVVQWRNTIAAHLNELEGVVEERQEIQNPYVVGVPLTRHQGIFVGREDISRRIEQLLRDQDHPPILLYGQRRMGKTSLLYNLRWMLPNRILPLVLDLQGPIALSTDQASFLYNLSKGVATSARQQELDIEQPTRSEFAEDPYTVFDDWLDELEGEMIAQRRDTILLALDEFETLDEAFDKEQLDPSAILGMLRHIIQHRPRFKLLLAGSHTLNEFRRWSSYLINAQTIHLTYLQPKDIFQLIEHPIEDFALRYEPAASERVYEITSGHPYLTQLICSEIVLLKNEQPIENRFLVQLADVEAAAVSALERGQQFFADIELNQTNEQGRIVLHLLAVNQNSRGLSKKDLEQYCRDSNGDMAVEIDHVLERLLQLELIERLDGHYQFQVELIRRWFAQT